jgi:hypothetical protein
VGLPGAGLFLGVSHRRIREDVGVASGHLLADAGDDVAVVECAGLFRHAGVEDDLEQEVAQLVAEAVEIVALDRVGDLEGLLHRVGGDASEVLPHVPGAATLAIPQPCHDLDQVPRVGHSPSCG